MPKQPDPLPESITQLQAQLQQFRATHALRKKSPPKFVELIGAPRQTVDEYLIEFESARGRKLRIHCKTNTPPDWPVLLRAWR